MSDLEGTFWIKPSTPVPAQNTILPPCDQIGITIIIPRVACFKRDPAVLSEERLIEAVKTAMAHATAEYPHLCGKITYANKETGRIQLEIPEDNAVKLVVKRHPHLDADELDRLGWPIHMLKREELTFSKYPTRGLNTYNFGIQANLIKGGVLLLFHMNHVHMDGIGHVMTEMVMAHHLNLALNGQPARPSGIVTEAGMDKSLAWGSHPARPILEWPDWRPAGPPFELPEGATDDDLMEMIISASTDFTLTLWKFTPEKLQQIRAAGQPPKGSGKKLSLASCLHSWLWKVHVRAREYEADVKTTCFTPVQTRGRVKTMPAMWSGSALVYSRAEATAKEVLESHISELGKRIEDGTSRWTEEAIREYWGSIEECPDLSKIEPNANRIRGTDVEFSNITTFPFHTLKWGKGLQPAAWRPTELAFTDAYVLLAPKLRDGSFEVYMHWTDETLENALKDPEWCKYAQFVCANDKELDDRLASTFSTEKAKL